MCELLGMCFEKPVNPSITFTGFQKRGEEHPHGWGIAFYPDVSAQVIKEPLKAGASRMSSFLRDYDQMRSRIILAHVRHATVGQTTRKNTHPFARELFGKEYVFAHNGTLNGYQSKLALGAYAPIGDTDSEYSFCHLLDAIRKRKIHGWKQDDFRWLHRQLSGISSLGIFNCLLSEGGLLFAYRGTGGKRPLRYVKHSMKKRTSSLLDMDYSIQMRSGVRESGTGYLIATKPLTDEKWTEFAPGQLMVFQKGKIVYPD